MIFHHISQKLQIPQIRSFQESWPPLSHLLKSDVAWVCEKNWPDLIKKHRHHGHAEYIKGWHHVLRNHIWIYLDMTVDSRASLEQHQLDASRYEQRCKPSCWIPEISDLVVSHRERNLFLIREEVTSHCWLEMRLEITLFQPRIKEKNILSRSTMLDYWKVIAQKIIKHAFS